MRHKVSDINHALLASACALALMSLTATADPLQWRNGYKDRTGKFYEADWSVFGANDGTQFAVDLKSIKRVGTNHSTAIVIAYLVTADDYDPDNLIRFAFGCKDDIFDVTSNVNPQRIKAAISRVRALACD